MWLITLMRIVCLRGNPQELPTSTALTVLAIGFYYATDVATALTRVTVTSALQAAGVDTLLLLALTQAALNLRHQAARLRQTVLALTGAGAIMTGITIAIGSVVPELAPAFLWWLSAIWLFAVYGHILRHAFDVSYVNGVVATGVYFFIAVLVTAPFLALPKN
jgi:hypothetical protein